MRLLSCIRARLPARSLAMLKMKYRTPISLTRLSFVELSLFILQIFLCQRLAINIGHFFLFIVLDIMYERDIMNSENYIFCLTKLVL